MTEPIHRLILDPHDRDQTVAFRRGLGSRLESETDHRSGRLRHPGGGGTTAERFRDRHRGMRGRVLTDPDGRRVSIRAPMPRRTRAGDAA